MSTSVKEALEAVAVKLTACKSAPDQCGLSEADRAKYDALPKNVDDYVPSAADAVAVSKKPNFRSRINLKSSNMERLGSVLSTPARTEPVLPNEKSPVTGPEKRIKESTLIAREKIKALNKFAGSFKMHVINPNSDCIPLGWTEPNSHESSLCNKMAPQALMNQLAPPQ